MKNINTVAELLKRAIPEEYEKIMALKIPHMGNLGSAYEGVSEYISEIICTEIDPGFSVVSGQISIGDFVIPGQIDRMIVHGKGTELGIRSGLYQYDISQVIAIIESKKTLDKSSLSEAISQLGKIRCEAFFSKDYYTKNGLEEDVVITSDMVLKDNNKSFDIDLNLLMLNQSFLNEKYLPLCIVYGHNGYASVSAFAKAYHDIAYINKPMYANHWFLPTLIISGNDVIMKGGNYPKLHYNEKEKIIIHAVAADWAFEALVFSLWKKINIDRVIEFPFSYTDGNKNTQSPVIGFGFLPIENKKGWDDPLGLIFSYESSFKKLKR